MLKELNAVHKNNPLFFFKPKTFSEAERLLLRAELNDIHLPLKMRLRILCCFLYMDKIDVTEIFSETILPELYKIHVDSPLAQNLRGIIPLTEFINGCYFSHKSQDYGNENPSQRKFIGQLKDDILKSLDLLPSEWEDTSRKHGEIINLCLRELQNLTLPKNDKEWYSWLGDAVIAKLEHCAAKNTFKVAESQAQLLTCLRFFIPYLKPSARQKLAPQLAALLEEQDQFTNILQNAYFALHVLLENHSVSEEWQNKFFAIIKQKIWHFAHSDMRPWLIPCFLSLYKKANPKGGKAFFDDLLLFDTNRKLANVHSFQVTGYLWSIHLLLPFFDAAQYQSIFVQKLSARNRQVSSSALLLLLKQGYEPVLTLNNLTTLLHWGNEETEVYAIMKQLVAKKKISLVDCKNMLIVFLRDNGVGCTRLLIQVLLLVKEELSVEDCGVICSALEKLCNQNHFRPHQPDLAFALNTLIDLIPQHMEFFLPHILSYFQKIDVHYFAKFSENYKKNLAMANNIPYKNILPVLQLELTKTNEQTRFLALETLCYLLTKNVFPDEHYLREADKRITNYDYYTEEKVYLFFAYFWQKHRLQPFLQEQLREEHAQNNSCN